MIRENYASAIKGTAALAEMLDCIGAVEESGESKGDHAVAKVLVDNELALRDLVRYALDRLAQEA